MYQPKQVLMNSVYLLTHMQTFARNYTDSAGPLPDTTPSDDHWMLLQPHKLPVVPMECCSP